MLKKIYYFIENELFDHPITYGILAVLSILLVYYIFSKNNVFERPSAENYEQIIAIKNDIAANFNKIYEYDDYEIRSEKDELDNKDKIAATVSKDLLSVTCYYNSDFSFNNYKITDLSMSSLAISLLFFLALFSLFGIIFMCFILLCLIFTYFMEKKYGDQL